MAVPRIILAIKNGARIAARHPLAVVVDLETCRLRRGAICVHVTPSGRPTNGFRVASLLCSMAGKVVSHADLVEALWGDDPSGGPLGVLNNMHQHIHLARVPLAAVGLMTVNRRGRVEVMAIPGDVGALAA